MKNKTINIFSGAVTILILIMASGCLTPPDTPAPNGAIQFKITDSEGKPLQGVKAISEIQPDGQSKLTGLTDTQGSVLFQNIKPGDNNFYINRFDYNQVQIALTAAPGQKTDLPVKLTLAGEPPSITQDIVDISFAQVISEPASFNGKVITVTGYWFDGFEIAVLAETLEPSSFTPGNVQPAGTKIWVRGGLPENVSAQLNLQSNNTTGYPAHYGKVELTGILEYGGYYGHMNAYQYQLTVLSARFIPG